MIKIDPKKHPKLVKTLEIALKVLKTVAVICFSLVLVFGVFFYARSCAAESAFVELTASAEESGFDETLYPSANLLPYPYKYDEGTYTDKGITFTVDNTGIILESGTAITEPWWKFVEYEPLKAGTYCFSGMPGAGDHNSFRLGILLYDYSNGSYVRFAEYVDYGGGRKFTVDRDCFYSMYLTVAKGYTVDNLEFKPMLNAGEVKYPFIPSFDRIYSSAYETGETNGYNNGYRDGVFTAQRGFLNNCKITCSYWTGSEFIRYESVPTFTDFGIDLSYLYDYFSNVVFPDLFSLSVGIYFDSPVDSSIFYQSSLRAVGISSVFDSGYSLFHIRYGLSSKSIPLNFIKTSAFMTYSLSVDSSDLPDSGYTVSGFGGFNIQSIEDFKNLRLYLANPSYSAGYENGYNVGLDEGYTSASDDDVAYANGFEIGYNKGKSDGFAEGFEQQGLGGFGWLISSVQSFLNTNFFGNFGIGTLLYVGLGVTLVTLFLKLFAK